MHSRIYRTLSRLTASAVLLVSVSLWADLSEQQVLFLNVEKSLKQGDSDLFQQHRFAFKHHPLRDYLGYLNLTNHFDELEQGDISQFVVRHPNLPQTKQLQYKWLNWLAKSERWDEYLQAYENMDITGGRYQCLKGEALFRLGEEQAAWKEAHSLWLVGKSQDDACDSLFANWREAGGLTQTLSVTRFWMAVSGGNLSLARYLDRSISQPEYKQSTQLFWRIHKKPRLLQSTPLLNGSLEHHRIIMLHGVKRLVSKDRDEAMEVWLKLRDKHPFHPRQVARMDQRLAMKFAKNFADNAEAQIARIDPSFKNSEITEWRIRLALSEQNWIRVLDLIQKLPEKIRQDNRWSYWHSVAELKASGSPSPFSTLMAAHEDKRHKIINNRIFHELSQSRNFYGFLVADLSKQPFRMNHVEATYQNTDLDVLEKKHPGFARIKEWLALDRIYKAQSELNIIAPKLTSRERKLLPYLAQRFDWHHQAIMSAARESLWNDLDLRFPNPQSQLFSKHAKKRELDYPWVVSIARQESAFNHRARSHAGARGLMQLMPATAKQAARTHRIPYRTVSELYRPDTNIALGTAHLAWLAERFENNKVFATAAYNAGSTAVKRWLRDRGDLPLDIWIETIPYDETRHYVQNVLAFRVIYSQRNNQVVRMFTPAEAATLSLAPAQSPLIVKRND